MLYSKIYLDKDEDGGDLLVFDSVKEEHRSKITLSGKKKGYGGYEYYDRFIKIYDSRNVAISREAKEKLLYKINNESKASRFNGNFKFYKESIFYSPNPLVEGQTKCVLAQGELLEVEVGDGISLECIERMIFLENETLIKLDISAPVDETQLLNDYYNNRRERGLDVACDAETIRYLPMQYLTVEQRAFIKTYYKNFCDGYDSNDWHYHGDFIYDKIIGEMAKHFSKCYSEIEQIIKN